MAACFFLLKQFDDVLVRCLFVKNFIPTWRLADTTFGQHDVWPTWHLADTMFVQHNVWLAWRSANMTFGWHYIWPTWQLADMMFGRHDVWPAWHLSHMAFGWHNVWPTWCLADMTFEWHDISMAHCWWDPLARSCLIDKCLFTSVRWLNVCQPIYKHKHIWVGLFLLVQAWTTTFNRLAWTSFNKLQHVLTKLFWLSLVELTCTSLYKFKRVQTCFWNIQRK